VSVSTPDASGNLLILDVAGCLGPENVGSGMERELVRRCAPKAGAAALGAAAAKWQRERCTSGAPGALLLLQALRGCCDEEEYGPS